MKIALKEPTEFHEHLEVQPFISKQNTTINQKCCPLISELTLRLLGFFPHICLSSTCPSFHNQQSSILPLYPTHTDNNCLYQAANLSSTCNDPRSRLPYLRPMCSTIPNPHLWLNSLEKNSYSLKFAMGIGPRRAARVCGYVCMLTFFMGYAGHVWEVCEIGTSLITGYTQCHPTNFNSQSLTK